MAAAGPTGRLAGSTRWTSWGAAGFPGAERGRRAGLRTPQGRAARDDDGPERRPGRDRQGRLAANVRLKICFFHRQLTNQNETVNLCLSIYMRIPPT